MAGGGMAQSPAIVQQMMGQFTQLQQQLRSTAPDGAVRSNLPLPGNPVVDISRQMAAFTSHFHQQPYGSHPGGFNR